MDKKPKQGKTFGIVSIVLSVLYLLISRIALLNIIFAILLILSLIFSIISIFKEKPKILGILGLILTIIGLVLGITYYFEPLPSKAKLLKEATVLDWSTVYNTVLENGAKKDEYENKYYLYQGKVIKIEEYYCILSDYVTTKTISVYLDKDDLKKHLLFLFYEFFVLLDNTLFDTCFVVSYSLLLWVFLLLFLIQI